MAKNRSLFDNYYYHKSTPDVQDTFEDFSKDMPVHDIHGMFVSKCTYAIILNISLYLLANCSLVDQMPMLFIKKNAFNIEKNYT